MITDEHDLWFWRLERNGEYAEGPRSQVLRACTGSKNMAVDISAVERCEIVK
jgi:hypothetical protein